MSGIFSSLRDRLLVLEVFVLKFFRFVVGYGD
jgi:hypothetical protein